MEIHQLRYFIATAECGNASRAAGRCHVAQPSLSQQLKKLETSLGVRLFDRLGRGMALTDAGRALLPRARAILGEIRAAEANIKLEANQARGTLTVGAIPTMAPYLLPPALSTLREAHKECAISVREGLTEDLVEALTDNEIDCALVSTPLQHDLLDVQVLGEERLLIVLPAGHPAAGSGMNLADLEGHPAVVLEEMHCLGRQIQGLCVTRRVAPRVVCRTTQLATIFELVALGVGLSIVPEMAAAAQPGKRCQYLKIGDGGASRQVAVAWRKNRTRPLAAVQFVDAVARNLRARLHCR